MNVSSVSGRKVLIVITVLLVVSWSSAQGVKVRIVSDSGDIRLRPEPESQMITILPKGTVLTTESMVGEWYRIRLPPDPEGNVIEGFIHSSRVEIVSEPIGDRPPTRVPERVQPPEPPVPARQPITYEEPPSSGFGVSLKLSGGMHKMKMDEMNGAFVGGWTGSWQDDVVYYGGTADGGTLRPIEYGIDAGVDLIIHLTRNIGVGFGAGYIQANKRTSEALATVGGLPAKMSVTPEVKALPVRAGLYLTFPLGKVANLVLNGGAGYYFAELKGYIRDESELEGWAVRNFNVKTESLGFHGGFGLEFNLGDHFVYVFEVQARSAEISGFKGTYDYKDSSGSADTTRGTLTLSDSDDPFTGIRREFISIWESKLEGPLIHETRDAVVDFSGIVALTGLRIRF